MRKKFKNNNSNDTYNTPAVPLIDFHYPSDDNKCEVFHPSTLDDIIDNTINGEVANNERIINKLMEIEAGARIKMDAIMLEARRKQYELLMNTITSSNCYNMRVMCDIIDKEN